MKVKQTQRHCPCITWKCCHTTEHEQHALGVIQSCCFYWPVVRTPPLIQAENLEVLRSVASKWLVMVAFVNGLIVHKPNLKRPKQNKKMVL